MLPLSLILTACTSIGASCNLNIHKSLRCGCIIVVGIICQKVQLQQEKQHPIVESYTLSKTPKENRLQLTKALMVDGMIRRYIHQLNLRLQGFKLLITTQIAMGQKPPRVIYTTKLLLKLQQLQKKLDFIQCEVVAFTMKSYTTILKPKNTLLEMLVVVTERVPIIAVSGKWQIPLMNWGIRILD